MTDLTDISPPRTAAARTGSWTAWRTPLGAGTPPRSDRRRTDAPGPGNLLALQMALSHHAAKTHCKHGGVRLRIGPRGSPICFIMLTIRRCPPSPDRVVLPVDVLSHAIWSTSHLNWTRPMGIRKKPGLTRRQQGTARSSQGRCQARLVGGDARKQPHPLHQTRPQAPRNGPHVDGLAHDQEHARCNRTRTGRVDPRCHG